MEEHTEEHRDDLVAEKKDKSQQCNIDDSAHIADKINNGGEGQYEALPHSFFFLLKQINKAKQQ